MADYPSEYELDIVTRSGQTVRVRPITPADADLLVDFFERLGPESRYYRFFRVKASLDPEEVTYFTTVDYSTRMALVALFDGRMVGVARYDAEPDDPARAEVAFSVTDEMQGHGIGTSLLQLITAYARDHGISGFRAFVLPENVQMMRVFRNSGYELKRTVEDGIFTVDFPVAYTDDARARAEERERRAVTASVLPLFFPRAIAVIGASTREGSIGNTLFRNLLNTGYTGTLYPVNPRTQVVNAVRAYPSIVDVPDTVDLAFIVVPAAQVLEVVRECDVAGVRGLVVISAGFSEIGGDGVDLEAELLDLVRNAGMRMVGPNCMGLLNTAPSVNLNGTFAPVYPPAGNVAMSSQSGALGIAILQYALRSGLGISQFVSVGNKADVSGNDLLMAWEDDPQTDVILLYLESFGSPRRFARIAPRVARKKPIVAVKSGRTTTGSRAASSHTGALASLDVAVDALFRQTGVIRVDTLEELFAVGSLLSTQPVPKGRRVGVVTNAGGPGILAADALEANGLNIPELSDATQHALRAKLPAEASFRNPVDMIAGAGAAQFSHVVSTILESGEVDALLVIYVPTSDAGVEEVATALRIAAESYDGPTTLLSVFMQSDTAAAFLRSERVAIPTYSFPESAAIALSRSVGYGEWLLRDPGEVPPLSGIEVGVARAVVGDVLARAGEKGAWLEPTATEAVLSAFGLSLPKSRTVTTPDEAVEAAREIGASVVLKVISESALHKSDVGGVLLDVVGEEAVRAGFASVTAAVAEHEGVLVQEMVKGGHEVLIGVTEDPNFGPLVVYGLGGVYVELLQDVAFRLTPLTDVDAREIVREIKGARLLDGYRGFPAGDVDAVVDTILRISALASAIPEITEMDLNPVMVLEPGNGVRVVDARIRVKPVRQGWFPSIDDLPAVVRKSP
ncbi:MAG TPA: bifunctional GNAT family N-acetyltransferase/acetate--CoA ligase family protein [Acidimicrobiia bacterium]|nr:bifunctional GNAT family N-acetyltransferase/acetate--CoA ligase family protein [Acidimicrobiia bacterium]